MLKQNKISGHKKLSRLSRSRGGDIAMILFLTIFTLIMEIPMVYAVSMSLKPSSELWKFPPTLLALNPTLKHYRDLFSLMSDTWVPMIRYIFNTLFITVVGTAGHIILASMAAYPLSKYSFPGSKAIFIIIRTSLMFSGAVLAIPNYLIINSLHLIDSYASLILPAWSTTLGLYLMKQFMDQMVPMSLLESADIDGASEWTKFSKLVMPLVKPATATLLILRVQGLWTTGATAYIYTEEKKTLSYALSQISTSGIARAGVGAAISIIMLVPPLLVFVISQSNVIETMSTSGIKE
jgi:ABC-type glycerol-3-phosphate transport system permease component